MARADAAARQLLDRIGWTDPPVDPARIAAEVLGVVIAEVAMPPDMSGMLVREQERVVIGVNEDHSAARQRFTIAHELGHFHLHKGRSTIIDSDVRVNFRDQVSSLATDREEIEANRFAAALLMPDHMVRSWIARESFRNSVTYGDLPEEAEFRTRPCACGCGKTSDRDFAPGHEVRAIQARVRDHFGGSPLALIQWIDANHPQPAR